MENAANPLSNVFEAPQYNQAYWHDHVGLCALARFWAGTNNEQYSLVSLTPRKDQAAVYKKDYNAVFLLPVDRRHDLTPVTGSFHVSQQNIEALNGLLPIQTEQELLKLPVSYFVFPQSSLDLIEELKSRPKGPNYSVRNTNPQYALTAEAEKLTELAHTKLKESLHTQTDLEELLDQISEVHEKLAQFWMAGIKTIQKNGGPS